MASTRKSRIDRRNGTAPAGRGATAQDGLEAKAVPDGEGSDLIDHTVAVWQQHAKRKLTREDGREIIENMTGFFRILREWGRAERAAETAAKKLPAESESRTDAEPSENALTPFG